VQSGTENTVTTQHAHDQEAAHPIVHVSTKTKHLGMQDKIKDNNILINIYCTLQRAAAAHKNKKRGTYKHQKQK
jgi:hypothetical protein